MNDLAQQFAVRTLATDTLEVPEAADRIAEFDASRVYDGELIDPHKIHNAIRTCRDDVGALGILLAQSRQDLLESVYYCNQKAWGYWDTDVGAPTPQQAAELLDRMDTRFAQHARAAHELRALCAATSDALDKAKAEAFEELHESARKSQEADD